MYYKLVAVRLFVVALLCIPFYSNGQNYVVYHGIPNTIGGAPDLAVQYYQSLLAEAGFLLKDYISSNGKTTMGPYHSTGDIAYAEKKLVSLSFQLQIDLRFDYSQVKSKEKLKYRITGPEVSYFFQGNIEVTPKITLLIRDANTNQLIEKILLDLDKFDVWIENIEASQWSEINLILYQENMVGINDVLADRFFEFEDEITEQLQAKLPKSKLEEFDKIAQEIKSRN